MFTSCLPRMGVAPPVALYSPPSSAANTPAFVWEGLAGQTSVSLVCLTTRGCPEPIDSLHLTVSSDLSRLLVAIQSVQMSQS